MQYTVKIKDHDQNVTHQVCVLADNLTEANSKALQKCRKLLGSPLAKLDIIGKAEFGDFAATIK